ncbi:MAG: hypothetical protein ACYC3L_15975 [Gemmatimonadaceae bacterium]
MKINVAHIREQSTSGTPIDFAVFDARSSTGSTEDNAALLEQLTAKARLAGLKIDQSALAYFEAGSNRFYGSKNLVAHLSRAGVPVWTHQIDA